LIHAINDRCEFLLALRNSIVSTWIEGQADSLLSERLLI